MPDVLKPMDHHEKMRVRAAAYHAIKVYPGPIGELIRLELLTWEDFGYRLGGERMIMEVVDAVLKEPRAEIAPTSPHQDRWGVPLPAPADGLSA